MARLLVKWLASGCGLLALAGLSACLSFVYAEPETCRGDAAHTLDVTTLAISADGQTLVSGSADLTVKVWQLKDGKLLKVLYPEQGGNWGEIKAVAVSPDGNTVVSSESLKIKIWRLPQGMLWGTRNYPYGAQAIAISPDGKMLASGGSDEVIKLWQLPDGKLLKELSGHNRWVEVLAISPDGTTLVSGGGDKKLKIWRLPGGELLNTLNAHHEGSLWSLAISPDGKVLASAAASVEDTEKGQIYFA